MNNINPPLWTLNASLDADLGVIKIQETLMEHQMTQLMDTKDKLIREKLIELGWTPPDNNKKVKDWHFVFINRRLSISEYNGIENYLLENINKEFSADELLKLLNYKSD